VLALRVLVLNRGFYAQNSILTDVQARDHETQGLLGKATPTAEQAVERESSLLHPEN